MRSINWVTYEAERLEATFKLQAQKSGNKWLLFMTGADGQLFHEQFYDFLGVEIGIYGPFKTKTEAEAATLSKQQSFKFLATCETILWLMSGYSMSNIVTAEEALAYKKENQ